MTSPIRVSRDRPGAWPEFWVGSVVLNGGPPGGDFTLGIRFAVEGPNSDVVWALTQEEIRATGKSPAKFKQRPIDETMRTQNPGGED